MINTAIIGFGNVGKYVLDAVLAAPDFSLACVVGSARMTTAPKGFEDRWTNNPDKLAEFGKIDVAILCLPSRLCPEAAERYLSMGINTVDSFDIHNKIWDTKVVLDEIAKKYNKSCVISAGWDPGTDSMIRGIMQSMAPKGLTYTNFGPGMSMGHTVAVKAIEGVKAALSMTIPTGTGVHRRMVYIELCDGYKYEDVAARIKADEYFAHDETYVYDVPSVDALIDMGHGVNLVHKGVSGSTQNQLFEFNMKINNPALTAQVMVSAARASMKCAPGCYTMIELPIIDMLQGDKEMIIKNLV